MAKNYNKEHFDGIDDAVKRVKNLYYRAIRKIIKASEGQKFNPQKPFNFRQSPELNRAVKAVIQEFGLAMIEAIETGISIAWNLADDKNDSLVRSALGSFADKEPFAFYMARNQKALEAFAKRKASGMTLSDRVWKYTEQFQTELELAIDLGLENGTSANALSRDVRQYLNEPEKLFRRVRNAAGTLTLSKAAKAYNPGQGVSRSSFKNAQRLTRTVINMAYREADHIRYQELDFIVGIEIRRSNNKYPCDLCESLKGFYPKEYKFVGNHPNCRCYVVTILATKDEIDQLIALVMSGKSTAGFSSKNAIRRMPEGWSRWIANNTDRILRAKSVPYFIADNFKGGDLTQGLRFSL